MTLILATMVRNEQKAIPRLLRSVKGSCTHVALTDTGSTDDTIAVATEVCKELGLILDVRTDVWEDFGTNRTKNLEHGFDVAKTLDPHEEHYLLLLDADMELPPNCKFPEKLPDLGMLPQANGSIVWWNARVINARKPARYVGRTHEYVACAGPCINIEGITLIDHADGGCRSDKFERDERLLRKDLEEKPYDPRTMFYLAQTLQNLGRKNEARHYYDLRAKHEDFPEEAWMSRFEASRCTTGSAANAYAEADSRAFEAYFSRPQRVEPLADIARRAADAGRHKFALSITDMGKKIPLPKGESLYVAFEAYKWAFPYVEMVSSYYVGDHARGLKACEFLHFERGSPNIWNALDNVVFYIKPIPGVRKPLPSKLPEGFFPASPCLKKTETGWTGIIRGVNYVITPEGAFVIGGKVITRNHVTTYDNDWNMLTVTEMISPVAPNPAAQITGFEDQRIIKITENIIVMAGVRCDASPIGQPELWESTWDIKTGAYLNGKKLSQGNNVEKNWMPFEGGYIYGHNPITVLDKDGLNGKSYHSKYEVGGLRGSAAPIRYKGGYLYVVHEVSMRGRRIYLHRFVHIQNNRWDGMRVSPPFFMKGSACIESCFSINEIPEGIVMSCAYEDKEIYTITVDHNDVDNLLNEGLK